MHPPLDRPHPLCQTQINNLKHCHATTSKLKFWGCNDVKYELDRCLKEEKAQLLQELNKETEEKQKLRRLEEETYQKAVGRDISFEEYLKNDRDYQKAVADRIRREQEGGKL